MGDTLHVYCTQCPRLSPRVVSWKTGAQVWRHRRSSADLRSVRRTQMKSYGAGSAIPSLEICGRELIPSRKSVNRRRSTQNNFAEHYDFSDPPAPMSINSGVTDLTPFMFSYGFLISTTNYCLKEYPKFSKSLKWTKTRSKSHISALETELIVN